MSTNSVRAEDSHPEWAGPLAEYQEKREWVLRGSGPDRAKREHQKGRLTARERIAALVDADTFQEFGTFATTPSPGRGDPDLPTTFVCGLAEIDGRPVAVGADDFTIQGGAVGVHLSRIKGAFGGFLEELALEYRVPLILLLNSAGGSITIQERKGYPTLLSATSCYPMFELLDKVPVVTAVMGPTAGGSAARAAISHFSVMSRTDGCLFAGGPPVVKQATGREIDKFALGGAEVHTRESGVIDNAYETEDEIFAAIRTFLAYLPRNVWELPPAAMSDDPIDRDCDEILSVVNPSARRPYDPVALITGVADHGSFFEVSPGFGRSLRVGLARLGGHAVGVLASDSRHLGGAMDGASADKQTRWVEIFDAFHLPIVYFVDVPGFMIGPEAERSGILRRGPRAVQAIARATVPVLTVQVRRSYGLAGQGTGNPRGHSVRLAWPSGMWGDMPTAGGIEAEYGREIAAAADPVAKRREVEEMFRAQSSMWRTAERFGVEEIIDPRHTRRVLSRLVELAVGALDARPKTGPQVRP